MLLLWTLPCWVHSCWLRALLWHQVRGASGKAGVPDLVFLSSLVCVSAAGKAGAEGSSATWEFQSALLRQQRHSFLCKGSLVLVEIYPLILVCVCVCEILPAPEGSASRTSLDRLQHREAGRTWLLIQLLIKRFKQLNYQIISKFSTVALFTTVRKKRRKTTKQKKGFYLFSISSYCSWNKGAVYIQNTKYLSHPQQGDLQYCIFGWELEAITAPSQDKNQPTRVFQF